MGTDGANRAWKSFLSRERYSWVPPNHHIPQHYFVAKVDGQLQREKQAVPSLPGQTSVHMPFPEINHGAPSFSLGKWIFLVSASLIFTKLTFFTRKIFLAELVPC